MLPSEMIILMAIAVNKHSSKILLGNPMDVTGEYIGYLYTSLVNRGYLKGNRSTGYQLTPAGREAVLGFLKKNTTRAGDTIKRLQLMGIEVSPKQEHKLDNLKKEATGTA